MNYAIFMILLWPYTIVLKKDFWNLHRPSSEEPVGHILPEGMRNGGQTWIVLCSKTHHGRKPEKREPGPPPTGPTETLKQVFQFQNKTLEFFRKHSTHQVGFTTVFESPKTTQKPPPRSHNDIQGWAVLTILHQGKHAMHSCQVLATLWWISHWFSESNMISWNITEYHGISWNIMESFLISTTNPTAFGNQTGFLNLMISNDI